MVENVPCGTLEVEIGKKFRMFHVERFNITYHLIFAILCFQNTML